MTNETVIRGAAHYNRIAADAWQQRAEKAGARITDLETALAEAKRAQASPTCPRCRFPMERSQPGGGVDAPPGTLFMSAKDGSQ